MSRRPALATVAVLVTALATFAVGSARAQGVFEACGEEISTRCADVQPGNGRLVACLYAHEEKLSESCDTAVADVADMLDQFFEIVRYANQECRPDIAKLCSGVQRGGGRILSCLKENAGDLSTECSSVMGRIIAPPQ